VPEDADPLRNAFQRDRDRIVHSNAFRRLVYKTQVFINHEGDLFRTRLTHSLEVAQLARSMARTLALHEDLVEAIALAHDLGHTPFGHAGQDALAACMREHGGFEHNLQSLRVVDHLEQRYAAFDGLNLSFEAREGILKHCSARNARLLEAREPGGVASRFLRGGSPSLEAQLVNLADEVAYSTHDIDDGLRSGLLSLDLVRQSSLFERCRQAAEAACAVARDEALVVRASGRLLPEALRRMLALLVTDLVQHTREKLQAAGVRHAQEARHLPPLVGFSPAVATELAALKQLLFARLYRHPQVEDTMSRARQVLTELFAAYQSAPQELPPDFAARPDQPRALADYVAGMTDRFALREHERLTGRRVFALGA
jgi:dGTPase